MGRQERDRLTRLRQRPPRQPVPDILCEMLKRAFLLRVSQPQAADDFRAANQARSLPEIGSGAVEEPRGREASLEVDVRVQQNCRVCAQLVARILGCNGADRNGIIVPGCSTDPQFRPDRRTTAGLGCHFTPDADRNSPRLHRACFSGTEPPNPFPGTLA